MPKTYFVITYNKNVKHYLCCIDSLSIGFTKDYRNALYFDEIECAINFCEYAETYLDFSQELEPKLKVEKVYIDSTTVY